MLHLDSVYEGVVPSTHGGGLPYRVRGKNLFAPQKKTPYTYPVAFTQPRTSVVPRLKGPWEEAKEVTLADFNSEEPPKGNLALRIPGAPKLPILYASPDRKGRGTGLHLMLPDGSLAFLFVPKD